MASTDAQDVQAQSAAPGLPDYVLDADAVLKDTDVKWRYGQAPDYSKTRKMWDETKKSNHTAGSLPDLVEKLVKNWEVEASHKTDLADWRTIDKAKYVFSVNGGPDQTGEHMLKVGTYNAILEPSEFYCPRHSTFDDSHKTFKHMMPAFAWEVLEVYSGPPQVAFRWRHWGVMKEDYVGSNKNGDRVTIKAHGRPIDIEGVAVAVVNDKLQLQKVEVFFDPMAMFRQMVGAEDID
ncbi:hypothetical protein B0T26DRAFT_675278 [Lasiosphaeria miniovina]|uniref:Pathogen-related protein n=1 Tax=Lasiosphaeria miniovina TaxID=1954250 RepID=A0AA40AJA5_9PEZI|nr:uncharacterized protein B0T26DRAFT_675278 [Lasiosphaeria miniovina]KAK0716867.1 hypothetical protein B0T26DRAFT_675278 [Lasiosphaeria miniovina]